MSELDFASILVMVFGGVGLGLLFVALRGTVDARSLVCARCRRDVRDEAWKSDPRCFCGAALSAAKATRLARRRWPRLAMCGGVFVAIALGVIATSWHLRPRGKLLVDLAPDAVLAWRYNAGDMWAEASQFRRWRLGEIGPRAALAGITGPGARQECESLALRFHDDQPLVDAAIHASLAPRAEIESFVQGSDGGTMRLVIAWGGRSEAFVRIERVTVDDRAVKFTIENNEKRPARWMYYAPESFLVRIDDPVDRDARVVVTMLTGWTWMPPPLIADDARCIEAPPSAWGFDSATTVLQLVATRPTPPSNGTAP